MHREEERSVRGSIIVEACICGWRGGIIEDRRRVLVPELMLVELCEDPAPIGEAGTMVLYVVEPVPAGAPPPLPHVEIEEVVPPGEDEGSWNHLSVAKGEGRRAKGEGRRAKGEGRRADYPRYIGGSARDGGKVRQPPGG